MGSAIVPSRSIIMAACAIRISSAQAVAKRGWTRFWPRRTRRYGRAPKSTSGVPVRLQEIEQINAPVALPQFHAVQLVIVCGHSDFFRAHTGVDIVLGGQFENAGQP